MTAPKKPHLDEATRVIAARMLSMPPKPHDEMKVGKPKSAKGKSPAKRTGGKGRVKVGKAKS